MGDLQIPFTKPTPLPGAEYWLNLRFVLNRDMPWAAKGHTIGWDQFKLPIHKPRANSSTSCPKGELVLAASTDAFDISGPDMRISFNRKNSRMQSYVVHGIERILKGPADNFFRAPTDIDLCNGTANTFAARWLAAGLDRLQRRVLDCTAARHDIGTVVIRSRTAFGPANGPEVFQCETFCSIATDGAMSFTHHVLADSNLPPLPRVGVEWTLPAAFNNLTWYGRGPHENYLDRKTSAMVGLYQSRVAEQYVPYIFPQENGGKEDVRWLALTDSSGIGLMIQALPLLHIDAHHNTIRDFHEATHAHQIRARNEVVLHLDVAHCGLGGDIGWGPSIHPEYLIKPGSHGYSYQVRPLTAGENATTMT